MGIITVCNKISLRDKLTIMKIDIEKNRAKNTTDKEEKRTIKEYIRYLEFKLNGAK